jgi:hypothetical protein
MTYKGYASGYKDGYRAGQDDIQKEWKVVARGKCDDWDNSANGLHIGSDNLYSLANKIRTKFNGKEIEIAVRIVDGKE